MASRYNPYASGSTFGKEDMRKEVVQLGVKLSVSVAQSMFLLCDEPRNMLWFCYKLWRGIVRNWNPAFESLLRTIHFVYIRDIQSKNGVFHDGAFSVQWELIRTTCNDFDDGIVILERLYLALKSKNCSFDDGQLSSAITKVEDVLKKLDDILRSAEDVSIVNGFVRETIESHAIYFWKDLFDDESSQGTSKVKTIRFSSDMFKPLLNESKRTASGFISHREMLGLPMYSPPNILVDDFAKQELTEEAVRLGVKLSLCVTESMFLLCDEVRSVLSFCYRLWRDVSRDPYPDSPVMEKLLLGIHYVYFKDIQPKNGVYHNGARSVQWKLIRSTRENFAEGIRNLERLVLMIGGKRSCSKGRELTASVDEALKEVEEKLTGAKTVSEANGFARDAIESIFLEIWKSVFDREAKEATQTLEVINDEIFDDLFVPLFNEAEQI